MYIHWHASENLRLHARSASPVEIGIVPEHRNRTRIPRYLPPSFCRCGCCVVTPQDLHAPGQVHLQLSCPCMRMRRQCLDASHAQLLSWVL